MTTATEAINAAILRLRTGNDCYYGDENARRVLAQLVGEVLAIVQEKQAALEPTTIRHLSPDTLRMCALVKKRGEEGLSDAEWEELWALEAKLPE